MTSPRKLLAPGGTDLARHFERDFSAAADTPLGVLLSQLTPRFVVSVKPDHPYLFDGPDILAGGDGRLLAIFRPRAAELSSPNRLFARLMLTKIALPDHARYILLADPERQSSRFSIQSFSDLFQAVVEPGERIPRSLLVGGDNGRGRQVIPSALRDRTLGRASFLLDVSLSAARRNGRQKASTRKRLFADLQKMLPAPETSTLAMLAGQFMPSSLRRSIHFRDGALIVLRHSPKPESLRRRLDAYLAPSVLLNYAVNDGVPRVRIDLASLLVTNALTTSSRDPLKPFRAAAFAGWAVMEPSMAEEVRETVGTITSWLHSADERP